MYKKVIYSLIIMAVVILEGCATGAKTGAMVSPLSKETIISSDSALYKSVEVNEITGGKETNPAWTSEVSNENFSEALVDSLKLHSMFTEEEGSYVVNAELKKLKQPLIGFNMTVTAIANYEVVAKEDQKVVFSSEIVSEHTAKAGEALLGVKRLRLANEGAIQKNIGEFIKQLVSYFNRLASG